jgi:hypothetical protein
VIADETHAIRVSTDARTGEPAPYVHVRRGLEARLSRNVFYQLAEISVPSSNGNEMGVWSAGRFFVLGPAA